MAKLNDTTNEWLALGEQLREIDEDKFDEVVTGLKDLIEARRIIARFDGQLFFRGRPKKQYQA